MQGLGLGVRGFGPWAQQARTQLLYIAGRYTKFRGTGPIGRSTMAVFPMARRTKVVNWSQILQAC